MHYLVILVDFKRKVGTNNTFHLNGKGRLIFKIKYIRGSNLLLYLWQLSKFLFNILFEDATFPHVFRMVISPCDQINNHLHFLLIYYNLFFNTGSLIHLYSLI